MSTSEELSRLDLFREKISDLRDRAVVRDWPPKISLDLFGIESTKLRGMDEDHLRAFIMALRQFLNERETTNFLSVCDLLYRECEDQRVRAWIAHSRKGWREALNSSAGISMNGVVLTLREILFLLMYGGIVHSDLARVSQLAGMPKQDHALLRMQLLQLVPPLFRALLNLDSLIDCYVQDRLDTVPVFSEQ